MRLLALTAVAIVLAACRQEPVTPEVVDLSFESSVDLREGDNFVLPPMVSGPSATGATIELVSSPFFQEEWARRKFALSPEYQDYVDGLIAALP